MSTPGMRFPADSLGVLRAIFDLHPNDSPPLDVIIVALDLETQKAARKFHFGTSERVNINTADVHECVMRLLQIPDQNLEGSFRNVILVGHGMSCDLTALRRAGIKFDDINSLVGVLDTTHITKEVLGSGYRLENLLNTLSIQHFHLHTAGNDANFCLKALLVLFYHDFVPSVSSSDVVERLDHLSNLGLEPLPNTSEIIALLRVLLRKTETELDEEFMTVLETGFSLFD